MTTRPRSAYWSLQPAALGAELRSDVNGLLQAEAAARLVEYGPNELRERRSNSRLNVLGRQLRSPLLLLLLFAAVASTMSGELLDASMVLIIVTVTVGIGYSREYSAQTAVAALRQRLDARARVLRDGAPTLIRTETIVPGDIVLLAAGSLVPADAVILEATDFFVSEAVLTGESFPVQKFPGAVNRDAGLYRAHHGALRGGDGTAEALVLSAWVTATHSIR